MKKTLKEFGTAALVLLGALSVSAFSYTKPPAMHTTPGPTVSGKDFTRTSSRESCPLNMIVETSRPRIINKAETAISSAVTAGLIQIYFVAFDEILEGQGDTPISEWTTFAVPDGITLEQVASKPISPKPRH